MTTRRRPLPEAVTVGGYITARAKQLGFTRVQLSRAVGLTPSMVYHWQYGASIPTIPVAERLAEVLNDSRILTMVRNARVRRCAYGPCSRPFTRTPSSHRLYCSETHKAWAHKNPAAKADPHVAAIEAMCQGCEPEGLCRTPDCPLRPFSPFVFVPLRRVS